MRRDWRPCTRPCGTSGLRWWWPPNSRSRGSPHRVTTHTPLHIEQRAANRFSVGGTPADCARIALTQIAPDALWLLAGINPGANLGSDVYQSGTVAAAREAAILGCKAMAVSQYISRDAEIRWDFTGSRARAVIRMLLQEPLPPGHFWNFNLPHPLEADVDPGFHFCGLDTNPHTFRYLRRGNYFTYVGDIHTRPRNPESDVAVCFGGQVAITRIALATTAYRR